MAEFRPHSGPLAYTIALLTLKDRPRQAGNADATMKLEQELAIIFFGVDASHHAVSRAVGHALTVHGLSIEISQAQDSYTLAIKNSAPVVDARDFWLIISINDEYFHPTEGGQHLLSAYPVMASFVTDNYVPAAETNGVAGKNLATALLDEVIEAIFREFQWPMLATTADGELLEAYRPSVGKQRIEPRTINGNSPFEVWQQWVEPVPWPTAEDYE